MNLTLLVIVFAGPHGLATMDRVVPSLESCQALGESIIEAQHQPRTRNSKFSCHAILSDPNPTITIPAEDT